MVVFKMHDQQRAAVATFQPFFFKHHLKHMLDILPTATSVIKFKIDNIGFICP